MGLEGCARRGDRGEREPRDGRPRCLSSSGRAISPHAVDTSPWGEGHLEVPKRLNAHSSCYPRTTGWRSSPAEVKLRYSTVTMTACRALSAARIWRALAGSWDGRLVKKFRPISSPPKKAPCNSQASRGPRNSTRLRRSRTSIRWTRPDVGRRERSSYPIGEAGVAGIARNDDARHSDIPCPADARAPARVAGMSGA
jgi:hypothetical protein